MFSFFRNKEKEIEKDKNILVTDLNRGDMDFLIKKMASKDIYSPHLNEKRKSEISNTDSVSWYAYRRAEKLNSQSEKEQLLNKLTLETDPAIRSEIYFCLAHLCTNTSDKQLFNFLMDKIETEDDKSKLHILIGVQEMNKDADLNIEPLKRLTKTKSSNLKDQAILALKHTNDNQVEDLLLSLFEATKDSHRKVMVCSTLRIIGTIKSIPILQAAYKQTRDYGLRGDIKNVIEKINERENSSR